WASEGDVSITPCHPSYMAPAFTMTGLSPVRKQYPSLGTPICKIEPAHLIIDNKGLLNEGSPITALPHISIEM
ncbi:MAG: hypothetical protein HZA47_09790, partial [Planctomycetes bacterium]|nr:hypothetical protein [Planctomycetota bacterium]